MNRPFLACLVCIAALPVSLALAACGSTAPAFVGGGGDDGGTDTGALPDGALPDGSRRDSCPGAAPTLGQACTSPGMACEYGGTGPNRLCTTNAVCITGSSGTTAWNVTPPQPGCIAEPKQNPPECPATFGTLPTGAACPKAGLSCVYDQGMCGCTPCFGDGGGGGQTEWACDPFPQPTGCPEPRPLIGSACTQEGQSCAYGQQCGVVSGPYLTCTAGQWRQQVFGAGACVARQCGQ